MKTYFVGILAVLVGTTLLFGFEKTRNLELDAGSIQKFEVVAGAGRLKIIGVKGLNRIEVEATIRAKAVPDSKAEQFIKRNIKLKLEKNGNTARLVSDTKQDFWKNSSAVIDLYVKVPERMNLEVKDGSGSLEIENAQGYLDLIDGSGSTLVSKIGGDTQIRDGSGSLTVREIGGDLKVTDGSGSIKIRDIRGNVNVNDGSGSMEITRVGGSVTVYDGSGSITIRSVRKDVRIKEAGSGGVSIRDVKGKIFRDND